MFMNFHDFFALVEPLGIDSAGRERWHGGWGQSQESFPGQGVYFLQEDFVNELAELSGLQEDGLIALQQGARQIRESEMLSRFAWHCHWRLNLAAPEDGFFPSILPEPGMAIPGGNRHLFTLATLAPLPRLKKYYSVRGISRQVLCETLHDLQVWTEAGFQKTGQWVCLNNNWLHNHMIPNLFALGRLEFQFGQWHHSIQVYKKRQGDQLCFIPGGNQAVSADGFRLGNPGEQSAFMTVFHEENGQVTGNPANIAGTLERQPVCLDLKDWELYIKFGEPVLHLHIPAGAPLRKEDCQASLQRAWTFFPKYFPEFKFKAVCCTSWLLDPTLSGYLPASNLAAFQSLFHLYPIAEASGWQTMQRVFGDPDIEISKAPQKTTLQKIVKEHLMKGRFWHSGGAFLLPGESLG